jgi:glycosyltransferase involved in cell wall biosynthesis
MPVYNAELYLRESIESVLKQTFGDFEFIIINDGSTDQTDKIIRSYNDRRISYLKNDENLKLIQTLNKGIDAAQGDYIARMDADDICMPYRLETQYKYMQLNPEIGACSAYVHRLIGKKIIKWDYYPCTNPDACRFCSILRTPLSHPASFFKTDILKKFKYSLSENALHIEAFVLWGELARANIKMAVIPERLLLYRDTATGICNTYSQQQKRNHAQQVVFMLKKLLDIDLQNTEIIENIFNPSRCVTISQVNESVKFLKRLPKLYTSKYKIQDEALNQIENVVNVICRSLYKSLVKRGNLAVKLNSFFKYTTQFP